MINRDKLYTKKTKRKHTYQNKKEVIVNLLSIMTIR